MPFSKGEIFALDNTIISSACRLLIVFLGLIRADVPSLRRHSSVTVIANLQSVPNISSITSSDPLTVVKFYIHLSATVFDIAQIAVKRESRDSKMSQKFKGNTKFRK